MAALNEFLSPASRPAGAADPSADGDRHEVPAHAQREEETGAPQQAGSPASPAIGRSFSPQLRAQPPRQPPQPMAIATRFQPTHSAKKKLARRNRRVRRLLQAYTAMAQAATLTSSRASAGWPETRIKAATSGLASPAPWCRNHRVVAKSAN